ncbi:VWA domain-containing protein [Streptomyces sp. MMG1121]|uniref:VWA domain-containing protein n=1 Tax=Streptomyces sp. MMG1121 TaxID=1415544 RepID=UPI0006ADB82F|nr:VWA domain-containing protein [Streptomyces sp. MMG1121]KOV62874.1 von Willebrand factor A [Streptomyces sp. MMG1121]
MPAPAHLLPAPPPLTETEHDLTRWEDDGGPAYEAPPRPHAAQWLRISAALGERLPELAGREDVIVTCDHGTRSGAPAAFYRTLAQLEIDAGLFAPLRPATIHPTQVGDEARYPVAWGAFTHEAAHAAHSRWSTPPALRGTALDTAAQLLEEARVEKAHLARRPGDRSFLRAAVQSLVLPDFTTQNPTDSWQAGAAAGLILARRDAGILDPDETQPLHDAVTAILGPDLLDTLTQIWTAAHATSDDDAQAMMSHAQAWCQALGASPDAPQPTPDPSGSGRRGELADVIGKVTAAVAANEAASQAAQARANAAQTSRARAKAAHAARARQAAEIASKVFTPGARPFTPESQRSKYRSDASPVTGTRPPTAGEKAAAGRLARALRAAAYRERATTVTSSAVPPGRLNMRGALARDAQKAAGAIPSAQPWVRTQRRQGPTPPLRVGIAVDVSGSMNAAASPIASAAWIVAKAAALTDPDSRTATIAYRRALTAITAPGRAPARVTEFDADGGGHSLAEAADALTAALDLATPGTGRLLVIASDGHYRPDEVTRAADRISALRTAGCAVLWLAFEPDPRPLPGATLLELADPAQAATAIGKAATTALAATNP